MNNWAVRNQQIHQLSLLIDCRRQCIGHMTLLKSTR